MIIWPGDLNAFDWWRSTVDLPWSFEEDLPEVLRFTGNVSLTVPLRKAIAEIRHSPVAEITELEAKWRGFPYYFRFDVPVSLWSCAAVRQPFAFHTPEGHRIQGAIDGIVGDGELLITATTDGEIDVEHQFASWRWRCALLGFYPPPKVIHIETYAIEFRKQDPDAGGPVNVLHVKEFRRLTFHPYPGLAEDVRSAAHEFAGIAEATGWPGRPGEGEPIRV